MTTSRPIRSFKSSERGATLVEYAMLLGLIVIVSLVCIRVLSKDAKPEHTKAMSTTTEMKTVPATDVVVIQVPYRDRVLYCLRDYITSSNQNTQCDWIRFYNENPDLVEADKKHGREGD